MFATGINLITLFSLDQLQFHNEGKLNSNWSTPSKHTIFQMSTKRQRNPVKPVNIAAEPVKKRERKTKSKSPAKEDSDAETKPKVNFEIFLSQFGAASKGFERQRREEGLNFKLFRNSVWHRPSVLRLHTSCSVWQTEQQPKRKIQMPHSVLPSSIFHKRALRGTWKDPWSNVERSWCQEQEGIL